MFDGPWEVEIIENEDYVYRQSHISQLAKPERRFPSEAQFVPHPDGLSVNWSKYCEDYFSWVIIGLSYKHQIIEYKDFRSFKVFRLNVKKVREINLVEDVVHDPVFNSPPEVGKPNNRSHSLIKYPNDEEARLKLSDIVRNDDGSECLLNEQFIEREIQKLKQRISKIVEDLQ